MSFRRTAARLCAIPAAVSILTLASATPASAHVTVTPTVTNAGEYTVATFGFSHGCDGSPTTRLEIQIPEQVLSVAPTRHPLWDVKNNIVQLDEPVTDPHGNEVTERTASIVYTSKEPVPDGTRDAVELSFQVPDVPGETLTFPTIQKCAKGENAWVEIPEEGQDPEELESPAPSFEVLPALEEGGHGSSSTTATTEETEPAAAEAEDETNALGWAGVGLGALGLLAGGTALARSRKGA